MVYLETHVTKSGAMKREAAIKKMKRADKLKLIESQKKKTSPA